MRKHLLLDLDGTLIDSSAGILQTLKACLTRAAVEPKVSLSEALIGPPLGDLVALLAGPENRALRRRLEADFRDEYDRSDYRGTTPFPGIAEALAALRNAAVSLHIVTNKRSLPTRLVLTHLGWTDWFATVSTLESVPAATSKSDVVADLRVRLGGSPDEMALVGDSKDDAEAARDNGIAFAWAAWGYGMGTAVRHAEPALQNPGDLLPFALLSRTVSS